VQPPLIQIFEAASIRAQAVAPDSKIDTTTSPQAGDLRGFNTRLRARRRTKGEHDPARDIITRAAAGASGYASAFRAIKAGQHRAEP